MEQFFHEKKKMYFVSLYTRVYIVSMWIEVSWIIANAGGNINSSCFKTLFAEKKILFRER